jgi:hypothetical protein
MHSRSSRNALAILKKLGDEGSVYLNPPATDEAIQQMQRQAAVDLGEALPDAYLAFLRVSNGAQIENAYFKEAENLVPENLDFNLPEVIVLGLDGNTAFYVFDKRDRGYHAINLGSVDERFESYESFEAMLLGVLEEQGVL